MDLAVDPATLARLLDPEESVELRRAAVQALAHRETPAHREALVRALDDADIDVRVATVRGLGAMSEVGALRERFAREPERAVRLAIVQELAANQTPEADAALGAMLQESSDPGFQAAANAIRTERNASQGER